MLTACGTSEKKTVEGENPFFAEYTTPFGVPPFDQIKFEHYKPALLQGMEEGRKEIEAIVNNPEEPTFENTIVALDEQGALLRKVQIVFGGQNSVNTNDEMQALSREMSPLLSKYSDDINLNPKLFARVKAVYDKKDELGLDKEQMKLLEETYKDFVRGGANLSAEDQAKLRELNSKISMLQLTFGQNMLKETNAFKLVIDKQEDLSGLPETLIANAAQAAKDAGMEGKWVFTLQNPSVMPFLQYSDKRELREKMFNAYINRGNNNNENDNKEVVRDLVAARLAKAKLMGYDDYASFVLEDRMAKSSDKVYQLLDEVWKPALAKAKEELADINAEIKKEGGNFEAEGWDWRYYFEKAKKAKFNLDENEVRPYLKLDNVREGAFYVANKLYGITFTPIRNIPLPYPEAQAFECKDKDGSHLGVIYFDFFPRASKRGGAWCGSYRPQAYKDGKRVAPVVTIVCNFSQPAPGQPALLSADEANTLFHEFGHALHGILSDCKYNTLSGTAVARDFVEMPSQFNESFASIPEIFDHYARHTETGAAMPADLKERMLKSISFQTAYSLGENLAATCLDLAWHKISEEEVPSPYMAGAFEKEELHNIGLLNTQIPPRYSTSYFNHVWGGGYAAGYYSYLWTEVLAVNIADYFAKHGALDPAVGQAFRDKILSRGNTKDQMEMFTDFTGMEKPDASGFLKARGL